MAEAAFQLSLISLFHSKDALTDILDEKSDLSPGLRDLYAVVRELQNDLAGFSRSHKFPVLKERIGNSLGRLSSSATPPDDIYFDIRGTIEILLSQFLSIPYILPIRLNSSGYVHTIPCGFHPTTDSINLEKLIVHQLGGQKLETLPPPAFIVYLKREINSNELVLPPIFLNMKDIVAGEQGNVRFVLSSLISYSISKKEWYVHIRKSAETSGSLPICIRIGISKSVVRRMMDETLENQLNFWNNMQTYDAIQNQNLQQYNTTLFLMKRASILIYVPQAQPQGNAIEPNPVTNQTAQAVNHTSKYGCKKGIEGDRNSCVLDSLLMSWISNEDIRKKLFPLLEQTLSSQGYTELNEMSREFYMQLNDVSNKLRNPSTYFCEKELIWKLRETLKRFNLKFDGDLIDIGEVISVIFRKCLQVPYFLVYEVVNDQNPQTGKPIGNYFHQIIGSTQITPKNVGSVKCVFLQKLFISSMKTQGLFFKHLPKPLLMIAMPRSDGKLVGADAIIPPLTMEISSLVSAGCRNADNHKTTYDLHALVCIKEKLTTSLVRNVSSLEDFWIHSDSMNENGPVVTRLEGVSEALKLFENGCSPPEIPPVIIGLIEEIQLCIYVQNGRNNSTESSTEISNGMVAVLMALLSKHNLQNEILDNSALLPETVKNALQRISRGPANFRSIAKTLCTSFKITTSDPVFCFNTLMKNALQNGCFQSGLHCVPLSIKDMGRGTKPISVVKLLNLQPEKQKMRFRKPYIFMINFERHEGQTAKIIPSYSIDLLKSFIVKDEDKHLIHGDADLSSIICKTDNNLYIYRRESNSRIFWSCVTANSDSDDAQFSNVLKGNEGKLMEQNLRILENVEDPIFTETTTEHSRTMEHISKILDSSVAWIYATKGNPEQTPSARRVSESPKRQMPRMDTPLPLTIPGSSSQEGINSTPKDNTVDPSAIGLLVVLAALKSKHKTLCHLSSLALGNLDVSNKAEIELIQLMANLEDVDIKEHAFKLLRRRTFNTGDLMQSFEILLSEIFQLQGCFKTRTGFKHSFITTHKLQNSSALTSVDSLLSLEYWFKGQIKSSPHSVFAIGINRSDSTRGVIPTLKLNLTKHFVGYGNAECKSHATLSSVICKKDESYCVYKRGKGQTFSCTRVTIEGSHLDIQETLDEINGWAFDALVRNLNSNPQMDLNNLGNKSKVVHAHLHLLLRFSIAIVYCNKPLKRVKLSGGKSSRAEEDEGSPKPPGKFTASKMQFGFGLISPREYSCLAGLLFSIFRFPSSLQGILHGVSTHHAKNTMKINVIAPLQRGEGGNFSNIMSSVYPEQAFHDTWKSFASDYLGIPGFILGEGSRTPSYSVDIHVHEPNPTGPNYITVEQSCSRQGFYLYTNVERGLIFNICRVAQLCKYLIPDLKISLNVKHATHQQQLVLSAVMCKMGSHDFISYVRDFSQTLSSEDRWIKRLPEGKIESAIDVEHSLGKCLENFNELELSEDMRMLLNNSVALFYVLQNETLL